MEIDTSSSNVPNFNAQKPIDANTPTSPGKRKKDYVYKLWTLLSTRCEQILEQYETMKSKSSTDNDINKPETDSNNSTSSNSATNNDVEMKESQETQQSQENNNKLTFETLGEFMRNKQLILLVAKYWAVLKAYIKQQPIEKESIKDARIILSTLMISIFPHDVLDVNDVKDMDALSDACYTAAQQVLKRVFHKPDKKGFEVDNQTKFHCEQAFKAVENFFNTFKDWQTQDKSKILESVLNFYEQWRRSYQVLQAASMNQAQKDAVLKTIENNANSMKKKILNLVDGNENEMNRLCLQIDQKLQREKEQIETEQKTNSDNQTKQENSNSNSNANLNSNTEQNQSSVEEQLRARGVPVNMKTGKNLVTSNEKTEERKEDPNDDSKYIEDVNGQKMLNLDAIIMEEASKKYWNDFEKEIEKENWSRLFELLSEVLQRVKKLSPSKDHAMLDDMIDVSFIQQTIQNGLIDATGFYGIFHGIWKQLRSLHAPIGDKAWDEWHDKILNDMSKSDATWAKLLSSVFNKFLLKIDEIENQVNAINAIKEKKKEKN